jgi:Tfp pilus assembly ATPase PilU
MEGDDALIIRVLLDVVEAVGAIHSGDISRAKHVISRMVEDGWEDVDDMLGQLFQAGRNAKEDNAQDYWKKDEESGQPPSGP